jgi:two-component system chemotaxis response regulator CheY
MNALVVDDSRAMRALLGQGLRKLGYQVTEAGNGREAVEKLGQMDSPVLALVDWNMPEMNGLELVRAVRANSAYSGLRLIMVTTETELSQMSEALAAGADEYIMKPFTPDVLQQKLELVMPRTA